MTVETTAVFTNAELALLDGHSGYVAGELLAERRRQINEEGWTPKHDERRAASDLALAGAAYAMSAGSLPISGLPAAVWPFGDGFKRKDPRHDLVRAGALIVAAIERLDRETIMHADQEAG